ncbi:hypothetical protein KBY88_01495 [Cyanobium sp. Morenito 9A2]|nr:hypothetical protein [Cyanobium sp. Morenito 9A2]
MVLKNGQLRRHQDSATLAQFRSDVRLASFWVESAQRLIIKSSGCDESSLEASSGKPCPMG